jgi:hypothetical protein
MNAGEQQRSRLLADWARLAGMASPEQLLSSWKTYLGTTVLVPHTAVCGAALPGWAMREFRARAWHNLPSLLGLAAMPPPPSESGAASGPQLLLVDRGVAERGVRNLADLRIFLPIPSPEFISRAAF